MCSIKHGLYLEDLSVHHSASLVIVFRNGDWCLISSASSFSFLQFQLMFYSSDFVFVPPLLFIPILIKFHICNVNTKSNCTIFWKFLFGMEVNYWVYYLWIERTFSRPHFHFLEIQPFYCQKTLIYLLVWQEFNIKIAVTFFISWYNLFIKNMFLNCCKHTCHFFCLSGSILYNSSFFRKTFFLGRKDSIRRFLDYYHNRCLDIDFFWSSVNFAPYIPFNFSTWLISYVRILNPFLALSLNTAVPFYTMSAFFCHDESCSISESLPTMPSSYV